MSIEINDLTNYYKLVNGSGGSLNLSYQQGGYDNMTPIMTFGNDGSLTANSLRQTVDPTDSSTPVLAQVNANGKLILAATASRTPSPTISGASRAS
jgi:hypothetical protein